MLLRFYCTALPKFKEPCTVLLLYTSVIARTHVTASPIENAPYLPSIFFLRSRKRAWSQGEGEGEGEG